MEQKVAERDELALLIRSRVPLVVVESHEEARALELVRGVCAELGRELWTWSAAAGLRRQGMNPATRQVQGPLEALRFLAGYGEAATFALLDFHPYLDEPAVVRQLRELVQSAEARRQTVLLLSPQLELPEELRGHAALFELALPDKAALRALVEAEALAWGREHQRAVKAKAEALDALVRGLVGMTLVDARRLVRKVIWDDGSIDADDLPRVLAAKYRQLDGDSVLSYEHDTASFADVAGLDKLKQWLAQRREVFLAEAPPHGLDPPRGVLLLGVQGAGKSLAAKSVAGAWQVPLLRLDFATLYNKYYGETERNLREALHAAGQMAPCVLWMDEIEKGLAADSDGGPSRRILGTLLTWMAERAARVFMVATANDIAALPPELMRKGRFDEVFFVDLPDAAVRAVIFRIHLRKRGLDADAFDLDGLAAASAGFSGAEVEQAVVSALYAAHAERREPATADLLGELGRTRPLSVLMAEQVDALRAWAAERTVPAS
ncbi:MAG TPA: AAA family ATPase [Gammaproteobacteria bacterium]